jgi:hypothetical protein
MGAISPLAAKPAPESILVDLGRLERAQEIVDGAIGSRA